MTDSSQSRCPDRPWMGRLEERLDSIDDRLRKIEVKMAVVEAKAAIWGGIAGFILSLVAGVIVKVL